MVGPALFVLQRSQQSEQPMKGAHHVGLGKLAKKRIGEAERKDEEEETEKRRVLIRERYRSRNC